VLTEYGAWITATRSFLDPEDNKLDAPTIVWQHHLVPGHHQGSADQ